METSMRQRLCRRLVCVSGCPPFCEGGQGPGLRPHGQSLAGAAHALSPPQGHLLTLASRTSPAPLGRALTGHLRPSA